jgi:hypothetical protein
MVTRYVSEAIVTRYVSEDLVTRSVSEVDGMPAVLMSDGACTVAPSLTRRVTIGSLTLCVTDDVQWPLAMQ